MIKSISQFLCVCAAGCLIASAQAAVNGFHSNPRVFNDFTTSALTIVNPGTNPDTASIDDRLLADDGVGGNFANRHDILASSDGGATNATFSTGQGFTVSTTLNLTDGVNAPRKEAGLRVNNGATGDVLFFINSDAGEIVGLGGGAPFHLFGNNGGGNGYTPGTPITLSIRYDPPGIVDPTKGLITYSVNYPAKGINTSFSGLFSNLEGGPGNGYTFGAYAQVSPANGTTDFIHVDYANLTATLVPEPASLGLISMGALALFVRRRRA